VLGHVGCNAQGGEVLCQVFLLGLAWGGDKGRVDMADCPKIHNGGVTRTAYDEAGISDSFEHLFVIGVRHNGNMRPWLPGGAVTGESGKHDGAVVQPGELNEEHLQKDGALWLRARDNTHQVCNRPGNVPWFKAPESGKWTYVRAVRWEPPWM
jgi:hypothetical protein